MFPPLHEGIFTVSIDLELGWGWRGIGISAREKEMILEEDCIVNMLLALLRQYNVRVTWAVVGRLLLDPPNLDSFGPEPPGLDPSDVKLWFSCELVESIRQAEPKHDLASHSFSHIPYDARTPSQHVLRDLAKAKLAHTRRNIPFSSFVFPWNRVGHLKLLAKQGIRVYRGADAVWYDRLPERMGRARLMLNKVIPVAPKTVLPKVDSFGMINVPGCMTMTDRYGVVTGRIAVSKARAGIDRAIRLKEVFHLWFHPAQLYYRRSTQFQTLEEILRYSSEHIRRGDLRNMTLSEYVEEVRSEEAG